MFCRSPHLILISFFVFISFRLTALEDEAKGPVPVFVFEKPIAPGADIALTSVGPKTGNTDNLCRQLLRIFRLSTGSKRHSLQSWKEVAAYVGRGVRTVQRWEEELGMPVHRPGSGTRATVFALVAEVDEWMKLQ